VSEQFLPGYWLRIGSGQERLMLIKFIKLAYQELFPEQEDFSHLARTVKQYLSRETPLWWVDVDRIAASGSLPVERQPVACIWLGNAIATLMFFYFT
jgi:hypothetical protein